MSKNATRMDIDSELFESIYPSLLHLLLSRSTSVHRYFVAEVKVWYAAPPPLSSCTQKFTLDNDSSPSRFASGVHISTLLICFPSTDLASTALMSEGDLTLGSVGFVQLQKMTSSVIFHHRARQNFPRSTFQVSTCGSGLKTSAQL